jgi:UDP-4-amino-4,6-dideoxy-N-acetyl-beta-L-altrosamine transaminase
MDTIPYGRQSINEDDIAAVEAVLRSDWLTQGPTVERFEAAVARYVGAGHACAVNSATSALHVACRALGLGPGHVMWTVPNTFVASSNAALYCGAAVDFVDIDPHTYNLSVPALREKLERAELAGRLPKIVMPVHFGGQSCDMREIAALARHYGFRVIEDASHAVGGDYLGRKVGCGEFSDFVVFSFHPVKIITTAEGGMLLTSDPALAQAARLLRSHGITRDAALMDQEPDGPWYYQQVELGYNYRLTDMQAALGLNQLERIDAFVARRREIVRCYDEAFSSSPLGLPGANPDAGSAWHLYVVQVDAERCGKTRKAVFDSLRSAGIQVNVHYIPVHLQPYYRHLGFGPGLFPVAERYYERAISIPVYAGLSDAQQGRVIDEVRNALR